MEPNFWHGLLTEDGIKLPENAPGNYKIVCPVCESKGSKGFEGKTLSVTVDERGAVWYCNRQNNCGHTGSRMLSKPEDAWRIKKQKKVFRRPPETALKLDDLDSRIIDWHKGRGIGRQTLKDWGVTQSDKSMGGKTKRWVGYPFRDLDGVLVNVKYRTISDKQFMQEKDAQQTFYGLNMVAKDAKSLVIVEGEMDALSLYEVGFRNVVSVPSGGISEKSIGNLGEQSDKFMFLNYASEWLEQFDKFVLACDFDEVGKALMEETSRRLGREKCWRVTWPVGGDGEFLKDANDVLKQLGPKALRDAVNDAEPWPISDVHTVLDYATDVWKLYRNEFDKPLSTGFPNLDEHMLIRPGEMSVVTGIPNSGKSEFMDALMLNMIQKHNWKFGICSFENAPRFHIAKLCEKIIGAPFMASNAPKMRASENEVQSAMEYLQEQVRFIRADDPDARPPSIDWIISRAKAMVLQFGLRGLVIDPYNEIESTRDQHMTETEYVSYMLGKIKRFAQTYDVHVWIVAHPRKINAIDGVVPVPGLYDIAASAHWANKADLGWCVHRDRSDPSKPSEVHILKVRFKECGTAGGVAKFNWDRWSGRYTPALESVPEPSFASRYSYDD